MKYEYNGNLNEDERIDLVAKEIMEFCPAIDIINAKKIAMLEGSISTEKNLEMEFLRLYNIMLILSNDANILSMIYNYLFNILNSYNKDSKYDYYYKIIYEIARYMQGERDFPLLDEFE